MNSKKVLKEVLSTSVYLLAVLIFTIFLVKYVVQRTEVVGSSMEDTLYDGDNVLVDKITYRFREPGRYDIVVFPFKSTNQKFVKRIIGLPGETVYIDDNGNIYVNEIVLYEKFGREIINDPGIASTPITLGEDEYFVLGDNRNNSKDSRSEEVGVIHRDQLIGKAWLLIWPINEVHFFKNGI